MHKRFSEEFKKSAIIRVQNGESQLSVANSLGISYKTLNRWIIQAKGQMPSENVSLSEENARLRKALKEREAEIAFLKKSLEPDSLSRGGQQYFPITPFLNGVAKPTLAMNSFFILETLKAEIKTVTKSYVPGVLVCYRLLRQKGISIDIKRLRRLMRAEGLFHRFHRKYVCTTDSEHDLPQAPNLLDRRFDEFGINQAWCGDITYIPTAEGWLYLASVIDLGTRRLVGYCFDKRMTKQLVINALKKAYENEQPDAGCIFHSDQGSQYCSQAFQETLQEYQLRSSMSRRAQCWDNAPAEAFWATLKRETLPLNGCFNSREEAKRHVQD